MLDTTIFFTVIIALMIAAFLAWLFYLQRKNKREELKNKSNSSSLPLQAYERLALLVDRIAIPNLLSRTGTNDLSAREMHLVLTKTIRDEFDYNVTQQIYVSPEAWKAVKQLKEKNMLLINQVAAALPLQATGQDLSRSLLHYLIQDPKSDLHEIVSEALSYEAKKLL